MTRNRVYLIVQAVMYALTAALLAAAAISLYAEGVAVQQETGDLFYYIYTREKAAARLSPLLPLIFAALGMTVAGWILGIRDENAEKPVQDVECLRDLTAARVQTPSPAMARERALQKKLRIGGWIAFGLCMAPLALYILDGAHFDRPMDIEADLFALIRVFVPWTALGIAWLMIASALTGRSMARETEAAKVQAAAERGSGAGVAPIQKAIPAVPQDGGRSALILRMVFVILAVALIVAGILNGGLEDVLTKANAICMECVGLG